MMVLSARLPAASCPARSSSPGIAEVPCFLATGWMWRTTLVNLVSLGNLKQIKPRRVEKEKLLAPRAQMSVGPGASWLSHLLPLWEGHRLRG